MKNKKILIISHQFLPFVSPRTTRWSLLIDELTKRGNEVTVLTGTAPEELKKNYEVLYFGLVIAYRHPRPIVLWLLNSFS